MDKRKLIKICTIITSLITCLCLGFRYLLPFYILSKLNIESFYSSNGSIGIISGADGPTAIYYGIQPDTTPITIVFGLLSIAGIIYLIVNKKVNR